MSDEARPECDGTGLVSITGRGSDGPEQCERHAEMCPHCGDLFPVDGELLVPHGYLGQPCPGSQQYPRSHRGDRRTLWNGEPNPWCPRCGLKFERCGHPSASPLPDKQENEQ